MAGKLTPEQRSLLGRMQADNKADGPPFTAGPHWEWVNEAFRVWLERDGIGCVEEQLYNSHFSSFPPSHPTYYHFACYMLYNAVRGKDKWDTLSRVSTTLPVGASRRVMIDGRALSWDVLISLDSLLSIASVWPDILERPIVVGDLGAGWGRIGAVLKQVNPQATYMAFDLPEALAISSTYLPRVCTVRSPVHGYADGTDWDKTNFHDGGLWFCGARELAHLPDHMLNCLVTTASFQEMPPDHVRAYFNIAGRVVGGVFYTLQRAAMTLYDPLPGWRSLLHCPVSWSPEYSEIAYEVW